MSYTLRLRVRRTGGAVVRVLDYLRRRRFEVSRVLVLAVGDGAALDLTVTMNGATAADPVARQVSKLSDVEHVELRRTA